MKRIDQLWKGLPNYDKDCTVMQVNRWKPDEDCPHVRLHQRRVPHVAHPGNVRQWQGQWQKWGKQLLNVFPTQEIYCKTIWIGRTTTTKQVFIIINRGWCNCLTWTADSWCRPSGKRQRSCWTLRWTLSSSAWPACWRWSPPCTPGSSRPRLTERKRLSFYSGEQFQRCLQTDGSIKLARYKCQECVAAFRKVTPAPALFSLH